MSAHVAPAQRIAGFGSTIFGRMSMLAVQTGSINLGQGFPDTDGPDLVKQAAAAAIADGPNQYPPPTGMPQLRAAIAAHQQRFYGIELDPDTEVLVTTGATEAIASALLSFVDPGDEVVVFEPYYDSYAASIQMAGGIRKPVTLRAPDFAVPHDELAAAITVRTKAILLNTPHNPTGAVLTRADLERIAALAIKHDLLVISDEVYEHMTYDGLAHVPICTLPGMAQRTITISSGGKTFSMTGWKIGWATGPTDLVRAIGASKQFLTYATGAPFQPAIAAGLGMHDDYFRSIGTDLQSKRDRLSAGLLDAGFTVFPSRGTYFIAADARSVGFDDGLALCEQLPHLCGVVAVPMSVFYDDQDEGRPLVRFAFCKQDDVLDEAVRRLRRLGAR